MNRSAKNHGKRKRSLLLLGGTIVGFASLVWFLIRVIPKPSRALMMSRFPSGVKARSCTCPRLLNSSVRAAT